MSIDVANESGVTTVDEERLSRLARYVLDAMRVHPLAELSVVLVDEGPMADLHVRWMDEPGPTDVLSFPMDELRPGGPGRTSEPGVLGDVIICPQVAERQAEKAGHSTEAEIDLLCTHGILHLLGYDHAEPDEHKEMFGLQGEILASWRESEAQRAAEGNETA
ncbi:rRNA maturation RNase YbeY [Nocardiopsis changdeensis]|uniref:Endoribonuclease YbeY n=1 Tax=Nocardiopsis changdeensis TaxID=2831969 RepID=A0ABX8BJC8_9ACTN|nr:MULTISPECIES: rRNA maturation RNase YbeY [Nocardiopsis]QUX21419.1 rRNA maturation RNase YbeY [Nocardiopsis changdeensis]QYX37351.1 rRNA maturation RNase YbeY [Nocardiopsis sp. MT53]